MPGEEGAIRAHGGHKGAPGGPPERRTEPACALAQEGPQLGIVVVGAVCWPPPALDLPSVFPNRQPMVICCPVTEGLWETPSALEMSL